MTNAEIIFSIIRSEVCGEVLNPKIIDELSSDIIEGMLSLSVEHDLAHIVASALSKMNMLGEDEASQQFNKMLMLAVYRDGQREYALRQISRILENAEVRYLPLKGSVICNYYPETWMRTSCDIDILIDKENTERALNALCDEGFTRKYDTTTHDYSLFSPNGVHLELHYSLNGEGNIAEADRMLSKVWDYAAPVVENKYQYLLSGEMFMLYHIAHMAKHFVEGGCGIKPFIDMVILKKMPFDADKLGLMLEKAGLLDFYTAAAELSDVWFCNSLHNELTKQMEEYILMGGVYGTVENLATMKAAKGQTKVTSFFKLMFLPRENLEVIYPKLKRYPRLLFFYQIIRWFRVFKKDKRKKIQVITKADASVLQAEADAATNLLKNLGII